MAQIIAENENSNDQALMMSIYKQYSRLMYSIARKFSTNEAVVEDLVQDSVLKLIPKLHTLKTLNRYALSAYIVYTVRNTAINYLRRQEIENQYKATEDFNIISADLLSKDFTPEELLLMSEYNEEFHRVWKLLTKEDQQLLKGKYFLELSDSDLAKQFGCKSSSIRMMLTRARRRALEILKEEEFGND